MADAKDGTSRTASVSASRCSTRPQSTSGLRRQCRLRGLSRGASGAQRRVRRQSVRVVPDDEPRALATGTEQWNRPRVADEAFVRSTNSLSQSTGTPQRNDLGRALQIELGSDRWPPSGLLPLHRAQSSARAHGGGRARLFMVQLSSATRVRAVRCPRSGSLLSSIGSGRIDTARAIQGIPAGCRSRGRVGLDSDRGPARPTHGQ